MKTMTHLFSGLLMAVFVLGLSAEKAGAQPDLQGTYEGKESCTGFIGPFPFKEKDAETMLVTQPGCPGSCGNEIRLTMGGSMPYCGTVLNDPAAPNKGVVGVVKVEGDSTAVAHLKAKAKPSSVKAGLKGVEVFAADGVVLDSNLICKWSVKRVATADPGVAACP